MLLNLLNYLINKLPICIDGKILYGQPSFIAKLLPNENDEFHDGSADEYSQPDPPRIPAIAPLRRTIRISKSHKNKQKKSLR